MLAGDDPLVVTLTGLVQAGDLVGLAAMLADHPSLDTERFGDDVMSRTALHVATDWPGQYPRVAETIALLLAAGPRLTAASPVRIARRRCTGQPAPNAF